MKWHTRRMPLGYWTHNSAALAVPLCRHSSHTCVYVQITFAAFSLCFSRCALKLALPMRAEIKDCTAEAAMIGQNLPCCADQMSLVSLVTRAVIGCLASDAWRLARDESEQVYKMSPFLKRLISSFQRAKISNSKHPVERIQTHTTHTKAAT